MNLLPAQNSKEKEPNISELFYYSQQRLLLWLSPGYLVCLRISFAPRTRKGRGEWLACREFRVYRDRIVVEIVGAVLPLFTHRLSLEGGGAIVKTLPWWRKLALLLAEDETRLPLSSFPNPPPNFDGRTPTFRPAHAFYRGYRCN